MVRVRGPGACAQKHVHMYENVLGIILFDVIHFRVHIELHQDRIFVKTHTLTCKWIEPLSDSKCLEIINMTTVMKDSYFIH